MPVEEGKGLGMLQQVRELCVSFVLKLFISLWPAGILGEVSGEDLNGIFISFLGMSFSMLIHQNVCVKGSGYFSH